jgi:hypothetical protein
MRSRGGRAGLLRKNMMMKSNRLLRRLRKKRTMEVTLKNLKMKKMNWINI